MRASLAVRPYIALIIIYLLLAACSAASPQPGALLPTFASPSPILSNLYTPAPTTTMPDTRTPFPIPPTMTATVAPRSTIPFTPSPTAIPPIRFAVIGDFGEVGLPAENVSRLVLGWNPDFIITTGDNNYPIGAADTIDHNIGQYYHSSIFPYVGHYGKGSQLNRFFPVLGNHDLMSAAGQPYFDYFSLPGNERYYDFTWGPVHFFALNSDLSEPDGARADSQQATWLRERMATSTAPWKLVYMHHPPYSSGLHGSSTWMRWPFHEWGATTVLAGHDHSYERLEVSGLLYFVNGLGGNERYYFQTPLPESLVRFNQDYGAMLVDASPLEITFQFITQTGSVVDTYTVSASGESLLLQPGWMESTGKIIVSHPRRRTVD